MKSIDTGEQLLTALMGEDSGPFRLNPFAVSEAVGLLGRTVAEVSTGPIDKVCTMLETVHHLAETIDDNGLCMGDERIIKELGRVRLGTIAPMAWAMVAVRLLDDAQFAAWQAATNDHDSALGALREAAKKREHERREQEAQAGEMTRDVLARASTGGKG